MRFCTHLLLAAVLASATALAQQPGNSTAAKANQCIGCHQIPGYRSVFPRVYPVPRIIGQRAVYLEYALKQYRSGERHHPSMNAVAAQLSDADIAELAAYYERGAQ